MYVSRYYSIGRIFRLLTVRLSDGRIGFRRWKANYIFIYKYLFAIKNSSGKRLALPE